MINSNIAQALIVTAEITGTDLTEHAARLMAQDLSAHPVEQVLAALTRCRREVKGRLTLADILSRLDDGRPMPQEAWAMVQPLFGNEAASCVWTAEMASAYGIASSIEDDMVAARMAFLEAYQKFVQMARDEKAPVTWIQCLGWDKAGRDRVLLDAVAKGRLTQEHASQFLSSPEARQDMARLASTFKCLKSLPQQP